MMWRMIFVHGIPLIIAVGAALLLVPWIMGASAIQGKSGSQGYSVGIFALFLYPASYQLLIAAWGVCRLKRWSLQQIFLQLIWLSLLLFIGAMSYSWVELQDYLQAETTPAAMPLALGPMRGS